MSGFQKADGMRYAPKGKACPVVKPGEFRFAAVGLSHGHIEGMCNGLIEAGGTLVSAWDEDPALLAAFVRARPGVRAARSEAEALEDPTLNCVASAAVPCRRCDLGLRVMACGKDYFSDKPALTTLEQLARVRATIARTGRRYMVYYSERLHSEAAMLAGELAAAGELGRIVHVTGMGPHRMNPASRPPWFFDPRQSGGILCDLGSHQIEQFLYFTGAKDARVCFARAGNAAHPEYPDLEDFGEALLTADNGALHTFRVDWFTPDGLGSWGDGRLFLIGTKGTMEVRKYLDVGREAEGDQIYWVDGTRERHIRCAGQVGYPFFGRLILDFLNRTETAMAQEHALTAARLAVECQLAARPLAQRGEMHV